MKLNIFWTKKAENDISSIMRYYNSLEMYSIAKNISKNIFKTIEVISEYPNLGKIDKILGNDYKYTLSSGIYKIVFKVNKNNLIILKIFDARRNPNQILED